MRLCKHGKSALLLKYCTIKTSFQLVFWYTRLNTEGARISRAIFLADKSGFCLISYNSKGFVFYFSKLRRAWRLYRHQIESDFIFSDLSRVRPFMCDKSRFFSSSYISKKSPFSLPGSHSLSKMADNPFALAAKDRNCTTLKCTPVSQVSLWLA